DEHIFTLLETRQDALLVVRDDAGVDVLQGFAPGQRGVPTSTPLEELLLTVLIADLPLVFPGEVTIVALIERLVPENRDPLVAGGAQDLIQRLVRALQFGCEGDLKRNGGDRLGGVPGLLAPRVVQRDISQASPQPERVPFRLAVANESQVCHA